MRLKILLLSSKDNQLDLNYKYHIESWIYKVLGDTDILFAKKLHDEGYLSKANKKFKFFTFSDLGAYFKIVDNKFTINKGKVIDFEISFGINEMFNNFLISLYKNKSLNLNGSTFMIKDVDVITPIPLTNKLRLKTISPIIMNANVGEKYEKYLHPTDLRFKELLIENLINKFETLNPSTEITLNKENFNIVIDEETIKRKPFIYKEIKKIAYQFNFEITGVPEVINLGYEVGFGACNSLGQGMCKIY